MNTEKQIQALRKKEHELQSHIDLWKNDSGIFPPNTLLRVQIHFSIEPHTVSNVSKTPGKLIDYTKITCVLYEQDWNKILSCNFPPKHLVDLNRLKSTNNQPMDGNVMLSSYEHLNTRLIKNNLNYRLCNVGRNKSRDNHIFQLFLVEPVYKPF